MTDPSRPSVPTEVKVVTAITGSISQLVTGLIFIAGGAWLTWHSLNIENHTMVYVGIGVAVFGAMLMPSIFPVAKSIYITFFPNGLPILGGRRAGDPPIPPGQ